MAQEKPIASNPSATDDGSPALTGLTHVGATGEARMVDVSVKEATRRVAVAEGRVRMAGSTLAAI
ncbi:MAG: cyclic pyranopterin monophosphate synthase MoaC, partial [Hyphomicrobiales bacterium]|nr:cyclic pyranopterin monophosphate synthase MoaC [Hyphomicrobiales bacterium]